MTQRDPDPFQAGLIELLRDASVGHLAMAAAAELLAAEHRMSWRFTQRKLHGEADTASLIDRAENPFNEWEQTAPAYLKCLAALERFGKDRNEAALIEAFESAGKVFTQACS